MDRSVFVLTSATYTPESPGGVIGVFETAEAAERYKTDAVPPVDDGTIVEWSVEN